MTTYNFSADLTNLQRSALQNETLTYPIPLTDCRVFDALASLLPSAAAADDLGLVGGTAGTDCPFIKSTTGSGTTVTQKCRFLATVPAEYIDGDTLKLRVRAKMEVAAAVSATVDISAYDTDGSLSADLCTTAATSINTTSFTDYDFVVTSTNISPGDTLDILLTVAVDDTGGSNACIANLSQLKLVCNVRG